MLQVIHIIWLSYYYNTCVVLVFVILGEDLKRFPLCFSLISERVEYKYSLNFDNNTLEYIREALANQIVKINK